MKVHRNIKSDKKTIAQLCEVLLSDEMYLCQVRKWKDAGHYSSRGPYAIARITQ